MKKLLSIFGIVLILAAYSCNDFDNSSKKPITSRTSYDSDESPIQKNKTPNEEIQRKLIKEGNLRFETHDMDETHALIHQAAKNLGGFISKDKINKHENRTSTYMVIRVPSNNFDSLLDIITENAKKLDSKNINVKDVTEDFIDVEARINAKKELEKRYNQILVKGKTVEDILRIEREIGKLRIEIESLEGRLKYLTDQISLSTLEITFYKTKQKTFGFGGQFKDALTSGWNLLLTFIIAITHLWPFAIIAVIVLFLVNRFRKKRA